MPKARKPKPESASFQDETPLPGSEKEPKKPRVAAERIKIVPAPESVEAFCRRVMKEHHPELVEAGVTLACNYATAGKNAKGDKPALKVQGHPVIATIRKASEKDTAQDSADITITIDAARWKDLTEAQTKAEIDAVLCRVAPRREGNTEDGEFLKDANDRVKLRYNIPDLHISGFTSNCERYGREAPPAKSLLKFKEDNNQLLMFLDGNGHG